MNDVGTMRAVAAARLQRDMRASVSCVNRGARKARRPIAGSMRFDTTKHAINQAFGGFASSSGC
ncbi:hypothetical protein DF054_32465 [Burkholderia cepacia]|nr:hypothetical protein DF055_31090 [Burkholderia cepacia]RRA00530.1 hypothetical protein DF054_32465 [Burkholderia cepacia]